MSVRVAGELTDFGNCAATVVEIKSASSEDIFQKWITAFPEMMFRIK